MRKKYLLITCMLMIGAVGLMACGKKSPSSEATTEAATTETEATTESDEVSTVATEETEATTAATSQSTTEATIADKKDEAKKPVSATGVYNGFGDSNSVEVEMSNGEFKTFIIEDEKVMDTLNDMEPGTKISFTYGALEGQANMQMLSVKKR